MKRLSLIASTLLSVGLFIGCGVGGNSSVSVSQEKVSGSVEASYLKNVGVCDKEHNKCVLTDSEGKFDLDIKYPANLKLKIGNYDLADVSVKEGMVITPGVMAENNVTLSGYLGVFLHKIAGCEIDDSRCDMGNVKKLYINADGNNLVEKVKNYINKHGVLEFNVNNKNVVIDFKEVDYYIGLNPLKAGLKEVKYAGAVTIGDYAKFQFDFDDSEVDYQLNGKKLNNVKNSSKFVNLYKNMFFVNKKGNEFYFITSGIMLAKIVNSQGSYDIIAIPQNYRSINVADVAKKYNFVVKGLQINGHNYNGFGILNLEANQTYSLILKNLETDGFDKYNGSWEINSDKVVLKLDGKEIINLTVKVGYNKNSIVVDGIDGGYGFGSQTADITQKDLETYYFVKINYEAQNEAKVCFGYTNEKFVDENTIQVTESFDHCMIVRSYPQKEEITYQEIKTDPTVTYNAKINPEEEIDGEVVKLSGIAKVEEGDKSLYLFLDGDNKIYVNIGNRDGKEVGEVGSSQLIK